MGCAAPRRRRKRFGLAILLGVFWTAGNVGIADDVKPDADTQVAAAMAFPSPCLAGCPLGSRKRARVLAGEVLVLGNNGETKFPDWIAYVVAPRLFGPTRSRVWRADPRLPENETLEPENYRGAYSALGMDRGHLAPLASFAGARDWRVTNYLSNVTPQRETLNRGSWARLEAAVRRLARALEARPVHVLAGPLYERDMPPLPNADEPHVVPSGYWKIVAIGEGRNVEAAIGFVMDQDLPRSADFCAPENRTGLVALEHRIAIDLFPDLSEKDLAAIEARSTDLARQLGC